MDFKLNNLDYIKIVEHCKTPMTFYEAIDYGIRKGLYVPTKKECEALGIFSFVWTSTIETPNTAYVNKINEAQPMTQKRLVILIEAL